MCVCVCVGIKSKFSWANLALILSSFSSRILWLPFFCHPFFSTDFLLNSCIYCLLLGIQSTHFLNTASVLQLQLFILARSICSGLNQRKSSLHKANIVSSSPNSSYYNLPCKRLPCERNCWMFSHLCIRAVW